MKKREMTPYLEHVLPEEFGLAILAETLENEVAEVREVDEALPSYLVGYVDDFLVGGVKAKSLHGPVEVLAQ